MKKRHNYTKTFIYMVAGFLAILVFIVILVNNIGKNESVNASQTAITIDDTDIKLSELNFYVVSAMSYFTGYEESYRQQGYDLWKSRYNDEMTITDYIMKSSMDQAIENNILYLEAEKKGMKLSEEERNASNEEAAKSYQNLTTSQKENYYLTKAVLEDVYVKKTLADKYRQEILDDASIDKAAIKASISLDDIHQFNYDYILFPFGDPKVTDSDVQNYISDSAKKDALKLMKEIHESIPDILDLKAIAMEKEVVTYDSGSLLVGDGSVDKKIEDELMKLNINGYSDVFETKQGYYIVHKTKDTSKQAYLDAVDKAIKDAEDKAFHKDFDPMLEKHKVKKNMETINTITVGY